MSKKGLSFLKIYVDGAARGNPGPAASAFIFVYKNKILHEGCDFIGKATNNTAEYKAIINALKLAQEYSKGEIEVYSDSNLAIQQINKNWKINYPHLEKLCKDVHKLVGKYENVEFIHVKRDDQFISICDRLCNERLDTKGIKFLKK
ncbi:MAG: ribonuclease HI family protein [Promethearchaeota archaeon]